MLRHAERALDDDEQAIVDLALFADDVAAPAGLPVHEGGEHAALLGRERAADGAGAKRFDHGGVGRDHRRLLKKNDRGVDARPASRRGETTAAPGEPGGHPALVPLPRTSANVGFLATCWTPPRLPGPDA